MGRVYIVGHSGREISIDEWVQMWKRLDEIKAEKTQDDSGKKHRVTKEAGQSLFAGDPKA